MKYLSLKQIIEERRWTRAMIPKILGAPDKTTPNPYYRSAAPTQLYLETRVLEAENTEEYCRAKQVASKRSKAAKTVANGKRAELLARVDQMVVTVSSMPLERLMALSLRSWRERSEARDLERGNYEADRDGSTAELETRRRWAVNFARHELTEYDYLLEEVAGKAGVKEAVQAIRMKVFASIAATWPELTDECARQLGHSLPTQSDHHLERHQGGVPDRHDIYTPGSNNRCSERHIREASHSSLLQGAAIIQNA